MRILRRLAEAVALAIIPPELAPGAMYLPASVHAR
jgi:hypothetical protein